MNFFCKAKEIGEQNAIYRRKFLNETIVNQIYTLISRPPVDCEVEENPSECYFLSHIRLKLLLQFIAALAIITLFISIICYLYIIGKKILRSNKTHRFANRSKNLARASFIKSAKGSALEDLHFLRQVYSSR